ncbi:MAG TPA: tetratricopeptide repeat protein [Planctomycetes bacterium]|nr:tetratricopeptide repeat protein [Planctomycetota bacterium]
MIRAGNKLYITLICAGLVLVTFVAFEQVRNNQFVNYDDGTYVTENRHVKAGINRDSIIWAFANIHPSGNWHPLTSLSHMLDCQLFGLDPAWHHMTSLLIHIASTLLLFYVLQKMTGAIWRSAFVAAAFALHPLHVESVAWVAERKDVLSGLFWMLTILAYIRYTKCPGIGRYLLIVLFFSLGLMAKPMLVTLPFVLILLDYWPLNRFQGADQNGTETAGQSESVSGVYSGSSVRCLFTEKIPLFALAAVSSAITFIVQKKAGSVWGTEILPLYLRIANALVSYIKYIGKMIFPTRLAVLYPYSRNGFTAWQLIICILILAVVSAFVIYMARKKRYLIVGWLWYLGTLVPVIGLIQVGAQSMADRYTYLPSIGIFTMVVWGAAELSAKGRYGQIVSATLAGLSLAALLLCTRAQVQYWQNSQTLCQHAIEVTEDNFVMHINLGLALYSQGLVSEAESHYLQALQIKPGAPKAHNNLAVLLIGQGALQEAIRHCRQALMSRPDFAEAHNNLGNALAKNNNLDEAIRHFQQALKITPDHIGAHNNLGSALATKGDHDEAVERYRTVLRLDPDSPIALYNLGRVLVLQGKRADAIDCYQESLRLKSDQHESHRDLGMILFGLGKLDQAIFHFECSIKIKEDQPFVLNKLGESYFLYGEIKKALRCWNKVLELEPELISAINNLAWVKATQKATDIGDPNEAVQLALRACELTKYNRADVLDTLAVAYAAAGRFDEAVATAQKAVEIITSGGNQEQIQEIRDRLELYRKGKPYQQHSDDRNSSK